MYVRPLIDTLPSGACLGVKSILLRWAPVWTACVENDTGRNARV